MSAVYLLFFPFSIPGFALTLGAGVVICLVFNVSHSIKLSSITISVILIVSTIAKDLHPFTNAGLRFAESAIGTGIAVLAALIAYHLQNRFSKNSLPK